MGCPRYVVALAVMMPEETTRRGSLGALHIVGGGSADAVGEWSQAVSELGRLRPDVGLAGLVPATQTIFRPYAGLLVELAAPAVGERLLDVGCGSAIVARVAVERQPGLRTASTTTMTLLKLRVMR
jgi:hypothetical protein